jgi:hypothetical protein
MPGRRRTKKDGLNAGLNVGIVATICALKKRGMTVGAIARLYDDLVKTCAKEAIRAFGVNRSATVPEVHMRKFGVAVAKEITSLKRTTDD